MSTLIIWLGNEETILEVDILNKPNDEPGGPSEDDLTVRWDEKFKMKYWFIQIYYIVILYAQQYMEL